MEIDAKVRSIAKLDDHYYVIPDYQREYVWKPEEQVEQFLSDIEDEFNPDSDSQVSYFIGLIILVKNGNKMDVIDGQQRLTTIVISICALRNLLEENINTFSDTSAAREYLDALKSLLYKFDLNSEKHLFRIELQYPDSKNFIEKLILKEHFCDRETESIKRMKGAYETMMEHYSTMLQKDKNSFIKFIRYFLTNVDLVNIITENLSSALKIFETINQRGVGLNAMDLVKNLLFSQARESDFARIKELWKELTSALEKCGEQNPLRFLRYFLIARYHDGIIREDKLYTWIISREGREILRYEQNPMKFAEELLGSSKLYSELVTSTEKLGVEAKFKNVSAIGRINKYKSRQHLMLLLALNSDFRDEDIEYFAGQISSYLLYSNTIYVEAKTNEQRFASWAREIRNIKTREELEAFVDKTIYTWACSNFSMIKSEFLKKSDYDYHPLYRLRFILGMIDNHIGTNSNQTDLGNEFYNEQQIEHIFPQTPDNDWIPAEFNDRTEYFQFVYKLGNVTLVESTINQVLNRTNNLKENWFEKKAQQYRNSKIITTQMLDPNYSIGDGNAAPNRIRRDYEYVFNTWNKENVIKRQEVLFNILVNTWRINNKVIQPLNT